MDECTDWHSIYHHLEYKRNSCNTRSKQKKHRQLRMRNLYVVSQTYPLGDWLMQKAVTLRHSSKGRHKGKHVLGHPGTGSTKEIHSIRDEREYWHDENIEMSPKTWSYWRTECKLDRSKPASVKKREAEIEPWKQVEKPSFPVLSYLAAQTSLTF